MIKVESINIAEKQALNIGDKSVETGIFKTSVEGKVKVSAAGLEGDVIVDTDAHGGLDQAVYIYHAEDYQWWSQQEGEDLLPGQFGENLTISGLSERKLQIGDRLKINDVVLELSAPRIPCAKLATRMNDSSFAKKFVKAVRPGFYARVIGGGEIEAGDEIEYLRAEKFCARINEAFVEYTSKDHSVETLKQILESPVSILQRPFFQKVFDEMLACQE